jgi:signal transduction histidine kinase
LVRDILADIVTEDLRASEVIQRLRALLKRGEARREPVRLDDAIEEVAKLTRHDLEERGVSVHCTPAPGLPQVGGDRIQLRQVVLNLVLNAAESMSALAGPRRRILISTGLRGDAIRVTVRDSGCGLPVDPDLVFQPFYTTKTHGLGLGLSVCRSIIDSHRGRLWAEPDSGGGAAFHFELPVCRDDPA